MTLGTVCWAGELRCMCCMSIGILLLPCRPALQAAEDKMLKRILSSQQRERQKVGGRPGMQRLIADGLRCAGGGLVSRSWSEAHANFWAWQVGGTPNCLVLPPSAVQPDDWEALEEEKENKNRLEIRWGSGGALRVFACCRWGARLPVGMALGLQMLWQHMLLPLV